jgi:hypothetical protein
MVIFIPRVHLLMEIYQYILNRFIRLSNIIVVNYASVLYNYASILLWILLNYILYY